MGGPHGDEIERVFRSVSGHAVATLIRWCGDISVAEDAVQDAFVVAMQRWSTDGVPANPAGWIVTTARRRGIDQLRRSKRGREIEGGLVDDPLERSFSGDPDGGDLDGPPSVIRDDRLRLMFTCCHPAIRVEHQVALTLRLLGGLSVAEIASAFLVSETAMARRLGRAKSKISAAKIPYRVPAAGQLSDRLQSVLSVLYLIYNAGLDDLDNGLALRREAVRLARAVVELMNDESEAAGLLALLLLNESRVEARVDAGAVALLRDQDRTKWDDLLIAEGHQLVRRCLEKDEPGPFQIQAAIQAVHCDASTFAATDWAQIVQLYDHLLAVSPSPVVAMNRAIALGERDGPEVGLDALEVLEPELSEHAYWHAARAAGLCEVGSEREAGAAYRSAADLAVGGRDREYFTAEAERLGG